MKVGESEVVTSLIPGIHLCLVNKTANVVALLSPRKINTICQLHLITQDNMFDNNLFQIPNIIII